MVSSTDHHASSCPKNMKVEYSKGPGESGMCVRGRKMLQTKQCPLGAELVDLVFSNRI